MQAENVSNKRPLPTILDREGLAYLSCLILSHGPLAKQGDVGMVPLFMEKKPPLKIGEVAETKIRPGFR
jgi:hypothetical protein